MSDSLLPINVRGLTFSYGNNQKPILNNLNLQLTTGARCLLIGANGAGHFISSSILSLPYNNCR